MMIESVNDINSTSPAHKSRGKKGSSASSQGSGRSHRGEINRRDTSSSSDQSDEERRTKNKRRTQRRRPPAFSTEEDDDERTDSADEGAESVKGSQTPPINNTSFYNQYSGSSFPAQPILKPLSPTSLHVGYGSDLIAAGGGAVGGGVLGNSLDPVPVSGSSGLVDAEDGREGVVEHSLVESPRLSAGAHHDNEVVQSDIERLSPDVLIIQREQDERPTIPSLPPKPVTIATAGSSSVLPSPSLGPPTTNTALPFAAGWGWGQPALYSPFCATGGSVAGTPAVNDGLTPSLPSGTNTYLQAVICQELDGVLVVNVRWRNKTFSGSLIDVQHHEWAPPRLTDAGVPEMTLKLKDLLGGGGGGGANASGKTAVDSEKDSVDVEVMEDQPKENGDQSKDESKESSVVAMETGEIQNVEPLKGIDGGRGQFLETPNGVGNNEPSDHAHPSDHAPSSRQPSTNGLPVPSIVGNEEKLPKSTPSLPPFDAVKSPQPQLALDDKEKPKEATPPSNNPPSVLFPQAGNSVIVAGGGVGGGAENKMAADNHVNFHTLVDVAASMKPVQDEKGVVSSDDTLSDKETSSDCLKSTVTYHPDDHGIHLHGNRGEDSDSSGSGSLSPVKKKTHSHRKPGGVVGPAPSVVVKETVKEDGKQLDPPFNSASFFTLLPPISPGDHAPSHATPSQHSAAVVEKEMVQPPKVMKTQFWSPATVNSKELDSRFPPNVDTSNPSAHMVPPHGLTMFTEMPSGGFPPAPPAAGSHVISGGPTHTVIQDKGKGMSGGNRKRKVDESLSSHGKHQMSPPTQEIDGMRIPGKPLPPLPSSFRDPSVIMQPSGGGLVQAQNDGKSVPDGFVYEPSLPMSREYQIIAYERERQKAVEEKHKGDLPRVKRQREHDHRHASSPSPPSAFKKGSGIYHQQTGGVIPPGVVVSDHMFSRHVGGVSHAPQIKQEHRPPSKGHHHHHHLPSGSGSSTPSSSAVKPHQQEKKRPHQSRKESGVIGGATIKKEPEQVQQWLSPAPLPPMATGIPGLPQPILNLPPGLAISSPSHLPPNLSAQYGLQLLPHSSALVLPPSKPKDSLHPRSRQTPSPNPKKAHDWPHAITGHPHVIAPTPTKPEQHGSGRHGNQLSGDGKSQGGGGAHLRIPHPPGRHKQESGGGGSSSSTRHPPPPHSHPPQPSPTHSSLRNGIAATPILAAGGVPTTNEEFIKLQLELQKSGGGLAFQSPQDFMTWQAAAARGQLSAMGIPQASEQAATLQMQLMQQQMAAAAIAQQQHQQQQQQNEVAMASLQQALAASQGMPAVIPFMQPFPLAAPAGMVPFAIPQPPPNKRDS